MTARTGPDFLVVGSPRSGTTLVQRLASELPGVRVTPETHFYPLFYEPHLRRTRFPLEGGRLRAALETYLAIRAVRDLPLGAERLTARLEGRCESAWQLFAAVVDELAGDARVVGEKTPNHLRWWRPLHRAAPGLRFVAVVRDPRAVVASAKAAPFGMDSAVLVASAWREDQRDLDRARRELAPDRLLELRYEDVVTDPDDARDRIGRFLGVRGPAVPIADQAATLFPAWEAGWKGRALGPVQVDRRDAWRSTLTVREVAQVEAVLGARLSRAGYLPTRGDGWARLHELGAHDALRVVRNRAARRAQRRSIDAAEVAGARR